MQWASIRFLFSLLLLSRWNVRLTQPGQSGPLKLQEQISPLISFASSRQMTTSSSPCSSESEPACQSSLGSSSDVSGQSASLASSTFQIVQGLVKMISTTIAISIERVFCTMESTYCCLDAPVPPPRSRADVPDCSIVERAASAALNNEGIAERL